MIKLDLPAAAKLELCFAPKSAAIIGASTDPMKFGGRALKFCLERGYRGRLYPVNAKNDVVQGVAAYRTVADVPEAPDVAVIAVPAALVKENLIAAGERGAKVAIVYGAQFAEAGDDGRAKQDELLAIARAHGMRMIGPNCMGVMSLASGFIASFSSAPEHHDGKGWPELGSLSVASQSGAVGIQMFAQLRDRGLGLANWISTGNQADIDVADAIAYYAQDPATSTIAVYMEDASRGLKLLQALELARIAQKPVVILKVGTTPLGGVAAAGHTAALYVEDKVVDDLFCQYGVLRAGSVNELIDLVAACNAGRVPKSNKIAAVSVSGGGAVMISDAVGAGGLELPDYPADALADLKATNSFVNARNPIDISAPSMSNMAITGGHLKWGAERGHETLIGYISHVPLVPRTRGAILPQLLDLPQAHPDQLIAIAGNFHSEDRKQLVQAGVAVFDDPTVATNAVAKLVAAGTAFASPASAPAPPVDLVEDVRSILGGNGVTLAANIPVKTVSDAQAALSQFGEIVLKLAAPTLAHRTEIDGVITGLSTPDAVDQAYATLKRRQETHRADYPGLSIIAQKMVRGVELLLAVRRDAQFGPLVLLGSGGTQCELWADLTYRKSPFDAVVANQMVDAVKVAPMLNGWRNLAPVSRQQLVDAIVGLSAAADRMPSFEINPLIVTADGAIGVDLVVESELS